MKICQALPVAALLTFLFIGFGFEAGMAQSNKSGVTTTGQASVPAPLPYCDDILPKTKQRLQKEADANCRTAQACVPCTMRESLTELYATIIVQPQGVNCKKLNSLKTLSAESTREQPFSFDILQSGCDRSGVSLEVILPDPRLKLSDFSFEWTIDGKVASKEAKLNCGCGKNATLKVTQNSTKQSVIKTMALPEACQSGVNSKE